MNILRWWRWLNKIYAWFFGYFWLPCPICGKYFGGHEWKNNHTLWLEKRNNWKKGTGVCYKSACRREAERRNVSKGFV